MAGIYEARRWLEYRSLREPCPICGKKDRCKISPDGAVALCFRIDAGAFREAAGGIAWLHRLEPLRAADTYSPSFVPDEPRPPLAPIEVRDRAIRALLACLKQSESDRADLEQRGFYGDIAQSLPPVDAVRRQAYRTLPGDPTRRILLLAEIERAVPDREVRRRLGCVAEGRDRQLCFSGVPNTPNAPDCQIYPVADVFGRFVALRAEGRAADGTRTRRWMSGGRGASVGSPAHVAWPVAPAFWTALGLWCENTIIFTEGEKKADLCAAWLGYVTLGAAGVGSYNAARLRDIALNDLPSLWVEPRHIILGQN